MHMGVSRCFPWLSPRRQGKKSVDTSEGHLSDGEKQDGFETLPDDLVMDVLSRLEFDQLDGAKVVCRRWLGLIRTAGFARLHFQRASPVVAMFSMFCEGGVDDRPHLFFLDWGSREKNSMRGAKLVGVRRIMTLNGPCDLLGSCDGLLVFRLAASLYEIHNPITRERIALQQEGSICGFFLHSLSNKYRLLSYGETPDGFWYRLGSLGPAAWKDVGMFPYRPREREAPSGVEGRLHWMVVGKEGMSPPCSHSIMVFSTGNGELRFMPHPGNSCLSSDGHSNMHLVETKGRVYVYAIHTRLICVWVLEDHASWHWVKKGDINLELDRHPASGFVMSYSNCKNMQLIDSGHGELLLFWPCRGFFRYNLQSQTIAKVGPNFFKFDLEPRRSRTMTIIAEFKRSLVSLEDLQ